MRFETSNIGPVFVVKVLDHRISADVATQFKQEVISYMERGNHTIVLDLSQVSFIDSCGLGALIASLKAVGSDGQLVICGLQDAVAGIFKLTRMDRVIRLFASSHDAAAALDETSLLAHQA